MHKPLIIPGDMIGGIGCCARHVLGHDKHSPPVHTRRYFLNPRQFAFVSCLPLILDSPLNQFRYPPGPLPARPSDRSLIESPALLLGAYGLGMVNGEVRTPSSSAEAEAKVAQEKWIKKTQKSEGADHGP